MFEPIVIAPSILSADFMDLGRDVAVLEEGGAGLIHVDVMDGHFVPNLSMGVPVVKALKRRTRVPLDVHLMIDNPARELPWFIDAGADMLTVHAEVLYGDELASCVESIHEAGVRACVALKPRTAVEVLAPVIGMLDMVLVMSVEPGFSGQSYIAGSEQRVAAVAAMARQAGAAPLIQVDGGIGLQTAPLVAAAGADVLVCGNAVCAQDDPAAAMARITAAADRAREAALHGCPEGGAR